MQPTDRPEFVRILNGLAAIRRVQITTEALDIWWLAIGVKWQLGDFRAAASHLVTSCQFMPTPYDFEQLCRAADMTASEAWTHALAGCLKWRTPNELPTGRIARAAAAVGGFRAIAQADEERDLPHLQRRFLVAYEELTEVESARESLPSIAAKALANGGKGRGDKLLPITQ